MGTHRGRQEGAAPYFLDPLTSLRYGPAAPQEGAVGPPSFHFEGAATSLALTIAEN